MVGEKTSVSKLAGRRSAAAPVPKARRPPGSRFWDETPLELLGPKGEIKMRLISQVRCLLVLVALAQTLFAANAALAQTKVEDQ
jgi:hypothetical protein